MIPQAILDQLSYVKVKDPALDLRAFPSFLIVGPQRTGTTWLFQNLSLHPQIMMPAAKELFFFSRLKTPEHPRFQSDRLDWYLSCFQESAAVHARKRVFCLWHYEEPYEPLVGGEATASYAVLDSNIIREITVLNPHLRVIMMIRHPVERAWSHAKKTFLGERGQRVEEITEREFEAFCTDPYQRRCAQYVQNIDRWLACLEPQALFVGRYEDVYKRPVPLLLNVLSFLGVRAKTKYIRPEANTVINATPAIEMPSKYRRFLESLLKEDVLALEERYRVRND